MIPFIPLGPLRIPSYGLMLALAFLAATVIAEIEFRRKRLGKNVAWDSAVLAVIFGIAGARINFLLEHPAVWRSLGKTLFSGQGLTWYGGFFLALAVILGYWRLRKVQILAGLDAVAPALALGYAVARQGCLLSGDGDYGIPSNLPWAMSFPHGLVPTTERVHPTPIYETLLMLGVFFGLWRLRRHKSEPGFLFWLYLVGQGLERFLVEFVRRNPAVLLGLTEAQLVSLVMIACGAILVVHQRTGRQRTTGGPG